MKILFCNIGWCEHYDGDINDPPKYGGKYDGIKAEIHNFKKHSGRYYGYVTSDIDIRKNLGAKPKDEKLDGVLVIWCTKASNRYPGYKGKVIVGWYKNATVYRTHQNVPSEAMRERNPKLSETGIYNITTSEAVLVPSNERDFKIPKIFRSLWYCNKPEEQSIKDEVIEYINNYTNQRN